MKNLKLLLGMLLMFVFANVSAQNPPFWNDIQAFNKQDSIAMPTDYKALFIGSSSFTMWKTLEKDLPEYAPLNRAFGGSTLEDLMRYKKDILDKYNPERIVIYCGENDIASSDNISGKIVFDRFKTLYQHIREKFPRIPVYYISLKPSPSRWSMRERMREANTQIEAFFKSQKHTYFINIWDAMLEKGKPNPSIFVNDSLHMNHKGYDIWMKEIRKKVKK